MEPAQNSRSKRNVRLEVQWRMTGPALPDRGGTIEIWLLGQRFRVRDDTNRLFGQIRGDLLAARGLGEPPHGIEGIMDIHSAEQGPEREAVELFGDLSSDRGWVVESQQAPWPIPATELVGIAHQFFAGDPPPALEKIGAGTRLGRPCVEYRGTVDGEAAGIAWKNEVHRIISPPYLLLDDVRAANISTWRHAREVTALVEGGVSEEDLRPPEETAEP